VEQLGITFGSTEAGDVLVDSITACSPTYTCTGAASFDWETANSDWALSNTNNAAITQTTTGPAFTGTGSLQVAFTDFPALDSTALELATLTKQPYCGQTVTYHVWVPADLAPSMTIKPFASVNGWTTVESEVVLERGAWNTFTYTPPALGVLGVQRLGLQVRSGSLSVPYSGSIFVDDVSWGESI